MILKPVDMSKANRRLFYELNNRGSLQAFPQLNDATIGGNNPTSAADAGNGFLMSLGYTILESGWDVTAAPGGGRFTISVPVAKNPDGSTITGPALEELVVDDDATNVFPLTYAAATSGKDQASLTVRERYEDTPVPVPADNWEYTDDTLKTIHFVPDGTTFQRGTLYEFAYTARDPLVAGLGFAGVRDLAAFVRHANMDRQNNESVGGNISTSIQAACHSPAAQCTTSSDSDSTRTQPAAGWWMAS
jgi:hypothetical protein